MPQRRRRRGRGARRRSPAARPAPADNGCQITRQVVLPARRRWRCCPTCASIASATATFSSARTATTVRWRRSTRTAPSAPSSRSRSPRARSRPWLRGSPGVDAPGDHVHRRRARPRRERHRRRAALIAAPADGTPAPASGTAPSRRSPAGVSRAAAWSRWGRRATAMYAGVAWIDRQRRGRRTSFVDGQAADGRRARRDRDARPVRYTCLGFGPGKAELTVSYQRAPAVALQGPTG